MPDHLPFEAGEDEYREDAYSRIEQLEDDVSRLDVDTGNGDQISDGQLATAVGAWIATRTRQRNLQPSGGIGSRDDAWFERYAVDAYRQGREFARTAMESNGYSVPRTPGIEQSSNHQHALKKVRQRQRHYWQKFATDLRDDLQTTLASQIDEGATVAQARNLAGERVETFAYNRARQIAHSEPAWAFNRSLLEEYADAGRENVHVDMRWETAGDNRVCPECSARSGSYSVGEARSMMESGSFPAHAECRCLFMPE